MNLALLATRIFSIFEHFSLNDLCLLFSVEEADLSSIYVEEGDIIVLGTDGLFDNLSTQQITREVQMLKASIGFEYSLYSF